MIIVLRQKTDKTEIERVIQLVKDKGLKPVPLYGDERTVIAVIGDSRKYEQNGFSAIPCVEKVIKVLEPYKLASKKHKENSIIKIGDGEIGEGTFIIIAGPCSIESESQIMEIAEFLKSRGVNILRASAFKPRSSPYSFQGMGVEGLKLLAKVKEKIKIAIETEVMDVRDVKISAEYVDALRIGARNMQNFDLLKEVGKTKIPIILKRGISATIKEWLMAAEYILSQGNSKVILCERGIRTFETAYRNTLDLGAIPIIKNSTHLPVIVDPSHAAGKRELVIPYSKAAAAIGADGIIVEVHPNPEVALSDGAQSLYPKGFDVLLDELRPIVEATGKVIA